MNFRLAYKLNACLPAHNQPRLLQWSGKVPFAFKGNFSGPVFGPAKETLTLNLTAGQFFPIFSTNAGSVDLKRGRRIFIYNFYG
jgi:hypothetical protein